MEAQELNNQISTYRKGKIKIYPCNNLRASNIGHPCERYLYLSIKNWEDKKPHDETLQAIFDLGNSIEDYTIKTLKAAGFEIITPWERSWKVENPLITGREDCRIKEPDGQLYPVEIKGLNAPDWDKLNCLDDFLNSKKYYIQGYPAQLLVYMWRFNKEHGYFCLTNKLTGEIKFIRIDFDYELAEKLLKKAENIYAALAKNDYNELNTCEDVSVCETCDLRHCCTAKIERVESDIDDGTVETLIRRKAEIKAAADEYGEINDKIKSFLNGRNRLVAGEWLVTVTQSEHKPYTVQGGISERLNIKRL